MAATGYTPIQLYYSATATNAPSAGNLAAGELAINTADGKLFYKDSGGSVQVIGWKTTPASAGGTGLTSPGTAGYVLTSNGSGGWVSQAVSGLPSQTGNNGKYLTTDGTTASWATIGGAIATPTLTPSTTTPTGGATITLTITNYNATYTYIIAVQGGTYTFNTGTGVISWTVPNVSSVTSYNCTVQAAYSGQASFVATQTVSVQTSLVVDTSIAITDFAVYSSNNGWAI